MTIGHHHIYFPRLHISLAWRLVLSRLAAVGLGTLTTELVKGGIPQTLTGAALVVCGALVAVLLAAPDAFQAAGILRPTAPDTVPLVQGLAKAFAGGITQAMAAPAAKRQAAFAQAVKAGVQDEMRVYGPALIDLAVEKANKTNMEGFAPADLGRKEPDAPAQGPDDQNAAQEATDAPTPSAEAETSISTDAIELTGGNQ